MPIFPMKKNNTKFTTPYPPLQERILFEDNHLIIINKMAGEIVQGDKTGDLPLLEKVRQFLKTKYNKPGNVFCGLVHRLDRPVSGAVIFAKTSKALARMNKIVHDRNINKIYWALVENIPQPTEGKLIHFIKKNEALNRSIAINNPKDGYQKAELEYKVLGKSLRYTLLEIKLLTGRHHQIRAQLAAIGAHIKGDIKYGAKRTNNDNSISLHAARIQFIHPTQQTELTIHAPILQEEFRHIYQNIDFL